MVEQTKRFSSGQVLGSAIKQTGEILRPFLNGRPDLLARIDAIRTPVDMASWVPLSDLTALLEIAEENRVIEGLAKSWAMNVLNVLMKNRAVTTPEAVLATIEQGFPKQHRGNVGRLSIRMTEPRSAEILDSTYAPCGYIITMVQRAILGYGATDIQVWHPSDQCRRNGALLCKYRISWNESDLLKFVKQ